MTTFSVYSNAKNLFNVSSSSKTLRALHGMKVFSINWVILGHTYIYVNFQAFRNLERTADFRSDFAFQVICNGFLSVDTFFFLSGFLVMYTTMESVKKTNGRFSVPIFLLHRYIRLTPTFMIVTASVLLLPLLGSGPVWHDVLDEQVDMCKKWWWKNVAFVNNFIGRIDQTCLHHTWYLCCDMQLFVLSLLVIIPLVKNKTVIGIFMNIAFVLASALSLALVTHFKQLPPSALFVNPDLRQQEQFARNVYFLPYTHLGPFAIGLLLGYAYWKHPQVKFSNNVKILGWLLAVTFGMASVYGVYSWNNGAEQHRPAVVLYAATHRIAWTLGVAWVTIVCITGQGGIVNKILSWKCLIPLSRITLEVYFIHPLFQWVYMAALHDRIDANHYTFLYMYLGHLLIVYVVAVVCCLAFDTPFYRLEKMLLTGKFKKNEESSKL
ncbi:nose resistant to fluoxetine protein 6-like isoform X2 [Tachypleus tridentatus]